jgi:uncharacterized protein (TIGR03000 family)
MRKRWFAAAAAGTLALLLVSADFASAQRFGRWGGMGTGYYGGYGYGTGLGNWGNNYGWGGTGFYPYTSYGYGLYPGNYASGFVPSYGYGRSYYTPGYVGVGTTVLPGNTTSMYYQPGTQFGAGSSAADPNAAVIDVRVAPDAQVWFDGDSTNQRGSDRVFTSPALDPGKAYHYDVKARWTENGKPVERTKRVEVRAGQRTTVDFNQDQGANRDLNTDRDLNRDRNRTINPNRGTGTNPDQGAPPPDRNNGTNPRPGTGTTPNRGTNGAPDRGPGQ